MNKLIGLLVFVFGSGGPVGAASTPLDGPQAAVRGVEQQEQAATIKGDLSSLRRLWSDEFIANNAVTGITYSKFAGLELVRLGMIRPQAFTRNIEVIRIYRDIAVVMGSEIAVRQGKKPPTKQLPRWRFTDIWKQEGDSWRLLARHTGAATMP